MATRTRADSDSADLSAGLREAIEIRRFHEFGRRSLVGIFSYPLVWLVVTVVATEPEVRDSRLSVVGLLGALSLVRFWVSRRLVRSPGLPSRGLRHAFFFLYLVQGTVWGLLFVWLMTEEVYDVATLAMFMGSAGIVATSVQTMAPVRWLSVTYQLLILLPTFLLILYLGGDRQPLALVIAVYSLFHIVMAAKVATEFDRTLLLEARQRESERRYRRLFRDSLSRQIVVDPARAVIHSANPAAERFFGHREGELVNMPLARLFPDKEERDALLDTFRERERVHLELRARRAAGQIRILDVLGGPIEIDGETRLQCHLYDVTERREHEQKINALLDEFRVVAESINGMVFRLGPEGRIYWCNPQVGEITAREDWDLQYRRLVSLFAEADRAAIERALGEAVRQGRAELEVRLPAAQGEAPFLLSFTALHDGTDTVSGLLAVAFDIREQARARDEALSLARAKSAFLANMSHEIRTPMNGVLGMLELLEQTELAPEQQDYVAKAHTCGRHLLNILNAILDLSRADSPQLALEYTRFPLPALIDDLFAMFATQARPGERELLLELAPDLPESLVADRTRLLQVLINLMSNAIKFTERGHVLLRVQRTVIGEGTAALRFEVEDTGIGIAPEARERIFNAFEQADSSTTRRFGGTGLGLALSRKLVQRMGGELTVASTPGEGSRFAFTLPLEAHAAPAPEAEAPAVELMPAAGVAGKRVLVVEDNAFNQTVLARMLEHLELEVAVAASGEAALQRLARERFDLVMMDVHMPGIDGCETTRRLRRQPGLADLPVVAVTADVLDSERERCLAAGMNAVLTRPVDLATLKRTVHAWLGEAPGGAVDTRVLQQLHDLLGEEYASLLETWLHDTPRRLARMEAALAEGDRETLAFEAHALKGSSQTLGARPVQAICERLERIARDPDNDTAATELAHLQAACEEVFQLLQRQLATA